MNNDIVLVKYEFFHAFQSNGFNNYTESLRDLCVQH